MTKSATDNTGFKWKITTKFNLLSISLILVTSVGIAGFILHRDVKNNYKDLLAHGRSVADIVAQNSEYGIYTENQDFLRVLLESALSDDYVAYAAVYSSDGRKIISRSDDSDSVTEEAARLIGNNLNLRSGKERIFSSSDGKRYTDIVIPVSTSSEDILGVEIPKYTMVVAPGRDLAIMVETAVRKCLLAQRGIEDERGFLESVNLIAQGGSHERDKE